MELNQLTTQISTAAANVHRELGPGLLDKVYRSCMSFELLEMGLETRVDVPLPIRYHKKIIHEEGFKIDLLVEDIVIVSLKSAETIQNMMKKQLLTYLRLAGKPLGLLINFQEVVNIMAFSGKFLLRPQDDSSPRQTIVNREPFNAGTGSN